MQYTALPLLLLLLLGQYCAMGTDTTAADKKEVAPDADKADAPAEGKKADDAAGPSTRSFGFGPTPHHGAGVGFGQPPHGAGFGFGQPHHGAGVGFGQSHGAGVGFVGGAPSGFNPHRPGNHIPGQFGPGFGNPGFDNAGRPVFGGFNPAFSGPTLIGGVPGGVSGLSGVAPPAPPASCRRWCRRPFNPQRPHEPAVYCCEDAREAPTNVGTKPGFCPPVRPTCPNVRSHLPPAVCSNDLKCGSVDKCCFDTCLDQHVCKPPHGVGRR